MWNGGSFVVSLFFCLLSGSQTEKCAYRWPIKVDNGGTWGDWGNAQYCNNGTYAVGFKMKIEIPQGLIDDTSLNGIELICEALEDSGGSNTVTSSVGMWGFWSTGTNCDHREGKRQFLTSFRLQVEPASADNDDTAANYVEFKCRDFSAFSPSYTLENDPSSGYWGSYGSWSSECGLYSAICGIKTRVEDNQWFNDDTSLNDVQFMCCS